MYGLYIIYKAMLCTILFLGHCQYNTVSCYFFTELSTLHLRYLLTTRTHRLQRIDHGEQETALFGGRQLTRHRYRELRIKFFRQVQTERRLDIGSTTQTHRGEAVHTGVKEYCTRVVKWYLYRLQ